MSDTAAHPTAAYPIAAITILGGYFAMNRQEARLSKVLLGVVAIFFPPIVGKLCRLQMHKVESTNMAFTLSYGEIRCYV